MNFPYELFLVGVAFFGFMAVVNVVQAHRKKEKTYYLGATVSFIMLVACVLIFLNQFIVALTLTALTAILSIAGLPRVLKVQERELAKQLQKADLSAPLRVRDFFTNIGWFKLASKWGLWETMCLFYLLSVVILGGIFFTLSTFYRFITIGYVVGYITTCPILVTFMFYSQFKKVWRRKEKP